MSDKIHFARQRFVVNPDPDKVNPVWAGASRERTRAFQLAQILDALNVSVVEDVDGDVVVMLNSDEPIEFGCFGLKWERARTIKGDFVREHWRVVQFFPAFDGTDEQGNSEYDVTTIREVEMTDPVPEELQCD